MKKKDRALAAFLAYTSRAQQPSGRSIEALQNDGGGEYLNNEFSKYIVRAGIQHILSPPYSPTQNGIAEEFIE